MEQKQQQQYPSVSQLIELARTIKMSDEQKEEQRRSFVYGNVAIEDETRSITREMVDERAKVLLHE
ncbi:hypothetical protein [Magnetovibrio blakemorei]|uniref:Uncharacterized protein n=1 Tax=Magnetovibrio blakemorei TaxID=28181 RepID=A0A1E5Q969_9PROT|nr:hypothetical protein [Magnetovibrio blakemorei]OEJ68046.1 hypothetical protein BEN30_07200 [Magnetovibrio blakemorei]